MAFTADERNQILLYLGVPVEHHDYWPVPEIPLVFETQVRAEIATIQRIEVLLVGIEADALAVQIGDLSVSYPQQIGYLKARGAEAVDNISHMVNIAVYYNKFQPTKKNSQLVRNNLWGCGSMY